MHRVQASRLLIGRRNKTLVVMKSDNGNIVATLPIGDGVHAIRFDPDTKDVFNSNPDGAQTVVHEDSANVNSVIANVPAQRGARTMELDPGNAPRLLGHCSTWPSVDATSYPTRNGARNI